MKFICAFFVSMTILNTSMAAHLNENYECESLPISLYSKEVKTCAIFVSPSSEMKMRDEDCVQWDKPTLKTYLKVLKPDGSVQADFQVQELQSAKLWVGLARTFEDKFTRGYIFKNIIFDRGNQRLHVVGIFQKNLDPGVFEEGGDRGPRTRSCVVKDPEKTR